MLLKGPARETIDLVALGMLEIAKIDGHGLGKNQKTGPPAKIMIEG